MTVIELSTQYFNSSVMEQTNNKLEINTAAVNLFVEMFGDEDYTEGPEYETPFEIDYTTQD